MDLVNSPQLSLQPIQSFGLQQTNALSVISQFNNNQDSILNVLLNNSQLSTNLFNQLKVDLISILNEVKDDGQLTEKEAMKLELIYSLIDQNAESTNTGSLTDFYAVLYLLSVLIF